MGQLGGDLDFPHEPLGSETGSQFGKEHLDGDRAVMLQVTRQVHRRHSATTQLALDLVAGGQGSLQAFEIHRHGDPGQLEMLSQSSPGLPRLSVGATACVDPQNPVGAQAAAHQDSSESAASSEARRS